MQLIAIYEMHQDAVIVSFHGEIDSESADRFVTAVRSGLSAAAIHPGLVLILDLRSVSFLGSSALKQLHTCHAEAADAGVAVRVVSDSDIVIRLMEATRVDEIVELYPSVYNALRFLARTRARGN
jgi:anti-sigma B factor antagonist